jgi:molecular chaperone DnaK (HSP70)
MDVIIPRNSKVPSKAGRQYTTSVDGQKNLKIAVYQGERDLVEHNRKLGEFILRDIPAMPAGLPKIDIQFILNADGILTVRARELRSGLETQVEIRPTYGITEEQMALMLLDSIQNAQSDMAARGLLEARNEAQNLILSGEKFLKQHDAILTPGGKGHDLRNDRITPPHRCRHRQGCHSPTNRGTERVHHSPRPPRHGCHHRFGHERAAHWRVIRSAAPRD